jgi:multicomponent Na+:H+ antiporter subunit G
MIADFIEGTLLVIGSIFILLGAIGILRMPDVFTRLQVTSKASVLGMTCILSATAIHFDTATVTARVVIIIAFVVLTMPIATHLLARAGYRTNAPLSHETVVNELAGHYDPMTRTLSGPEPEMLIFELSPQAAIIGKRIADLGLPSGALIRAIHRPSGTVIPKGQTILEAGDKVEVIIAREEFDAVREIFDAEAGRAR